MPDSLDKKAARMRDWRAEHPAESAERDRRWREQHPEEARALDHKKYENRIEKHGQQAWRDEGLKTFHRSLLKKAGRPKPERCEVCNQPGRIHFDHDHACCKYGCRKCFRGWICDHCNWALGNVEDDVLRLEALARYLRRWHSVP